MQQEFRGDIAASLSAVQYMGMLENIFTVDGQRGHQRCLMYEAFRDALDYVVIGREVYEQFRALWKPLSLFSDGDVPLYANGLLSSLEQTS